MIWIIFIEIGNYWVSEVEVVVRVVIIVFLFFEYSVIDDLNILFDFVIFSEFELL